MADTKRKIGSIAATLIKLAFRALGGFMNRIPDEQLRLMLEALRQSLIDFVTVLSDSDPRDTEQVRGVLNTFLTSAGFRQGSGAYIDQGIAQIPNANTRTVLTNFKPLVYQIGDKLTDANPDNLKQIEAIGKQFGTSEAGLATMVAMFDWFLDEESAAIIAQFISDYLEQIFEEDPERAEAMLVSIEGVRNLRKDADNRLEKALVA